LFFSKQIKGPLLFFHPIAYKYLGMISEISSRKLRRMMQIIFIFFLAIALKAWHLEVVDRDEKVRLSMLPKRRTIVQKADRGILTDRFQIPLAINRICYNATIYYNQITTIAPRGWTVDTEGNKVRRFPRKEYIQKMAQELAKVLSLDASRVEDLIHSKASLFPHAPFLLKGNLTEEEHYRLALLEKEWPPLHAEIASERFYPRGKSGAEVIGSMGCISSKKYLSIAEEIRVLQQIVEETHQGLEPEFPSPSDTVETLEKRLFQLKEQAYTIQDLVGKAGAEGQFEETLRGFYGKKFFEVDQKGKILAEMEGSKPAVPGTPQRLSISIELQEAAERLLAQDEEFRSGRSLGLDFNTKKRKALKQPFVKGGSIVALNPRTGEVLAIASTPRFDPNDFIPTSNPALLNEKRQRVCRWLENEKAIASVWDGKEPLRRERYNLKKGFHEEALPLTWDLFLTLILPEEGPLHAFFAQVTDVKTAVQLQEELENLLYQSGLRDPAALFEKFPPPEALSSLSSHEDRLFAIDLCRLAVHAPAFTDASLKVLGSMKLSDYRSINQAVCRLEERLKQERKQTFHAVEFASWREANQKDFLAAARILEKEKHLAPRPYLDLLDQKERELFTIYWKEHRLEILTSNLLQDPTCSMLAQPSFEETKAILHTFRSYADLKRPLLMNYRSLRKGGTEKQLAASFYPLDGFGHTRSYAFQASAPQGSVFKLVTAYAGLIATKGANPFHIIDEWQGTKGVATTLGGALYPRIYKGGRLPKSSSGHIGKIDLVGAIERSSNPYFALIAGDILHNPEDLNAAAQQFSFGALTGIELPGEVSGSLPKDLRLNRTGLYSTAMGQHTLLTTPLQAAVMLSTIANGGHVLKPQILQTDSPEISRSMQLPPLIRFQLLEGMDRAIWSEKGTARSNIIRHLKLNPEWNKRYLDLKHQMVGKTGTAELLYNPNMNPSSKASIYKHIWFGAISLAEKTEDPELVVIVFLRYGDHGREAAALASEMIHAWRQIQKTHAPKT
jgi:cell division protein FtsI/penicillin-binding protein 2